MSFPFVTDEDRRNIQLFERHLGKIQQCQDDLKLSLADICRQHDEGMSQIDDSLNAIRAYLDREEKNIRKELTIKFGIVQRRIIDRLNEVARQNEEAKEAWDRIEKACAPVNLSLRKQRSAAIRSIMNEQMNIGQPFLKKPPEIKVNFGSQSQRLLDAKEGLAVVRTRDLKLDVREGQKIQPMTPSSRPSPSGKALNNIKRTALRYRTLQRECKRLRELIHKGKKKGKREGEVKDIEELIYMYRRTQRTQRDVESEVEKIYKRCRNPTAPVSVEVMIRTLLEIKSNKSNKVYWEPTAEAIFEENEHTNEREWAALEQPDEKLDVISPRSVKCGHGRKNYSLVSDVQIRLGEYYDFLNNLGKWRVVEVEKIDSDVPQALVRPLVEGQKEWVILGSPELQPLHTQTCKICFKIAVSQ